MKRAVIYCRASLDVSGERASVERQEKACRALAEARGWDIVGVAQVDNSISAYDDETDRPAWNAVLERVQAGEVDVIIAWHLDRMTRSMLALEKLILLCDEHNVGVATATGDIDLTTDTGRMVARILAAVARAEVERKAARQKLANNARAVVGEPFTGGPRPFGYAHNGIAVIEKEADGVRWAAQAALAGMSMAKIGAELELRGLHSTRAKYSKSGTGWSVGGVRKMLISRRYAGIAMYRGEEVAQGKWEPILDLETHQALVRLLNDPGRDTNPGAVRNTRKPTTLLSLIAVCDSCGNTLIGASRTHYTCRSKKGCVLAPRQLLDDAATEAVLGLLSTPGFLDSLIPANDDRVAVARRMIDRLHGRLGLLNDDLAAGNYDDNPAEYRRVAAEIRGAIAAQRSMIEDLSETRLFDGLAIGTEQVIEQWEELNLERKRTIIDRLLTLRVRPTGARRSWAPERHLEVRRRAA